MTRRTILAGSAGLAAGLTTTAPFLLPRYDHVRKPARSRVAILHADSYSQRLEQTLWKALEEFKLDVRRKSVLLKPNLVDYISGNHINTDPLLVAASAECFKRLGAASALVAEGPGHQRDTQLVYRTEYRGQPDASKRLPCRGEPNVQEGGRFHATGLNVLQPDERVSFAAWDRL
jgi:hypothetical protein